MRKGQQSRPSLPNDLVLPQGEPIDPADYEDMAVPADDERPSRAPSLGAKTIVRDLDRASDERLARLRRQRAMQLKARADNPFIDEEQPGLPPLPGADDDPEWAYKWIRHSLPAASGTENRQVDTQNLQGSVHGRLPYEFVRVDMLPPAWQAKMQTFSVMEGRHAGFLVYNDLIAGRTPRRLRDMKVAANEYKAEQQRADIRGGLSEQMRRNGFRPWSEDEERLEGRDHIPRDWEI